LLEVRLGWTRWRRWNGGRQWAQSHCTLTHRCKHCIRHLYWCCQCYSHRPYDDRHARISVVNHLIHGNFKFLCRNLVLNSRARLYGQGRGGNYAVANGHNFMKNELQGSSQLRNWSEIAFRAILLLGWCSCHQYWLSYTLVPQLFDKSWYVFLCI
jgi:hypothetical protein